MDIFAESTLVKRHNENQLKQIPGRLINIPVKEELPKNRKVSDKRKRKIKNSPIVGVASLLELKIIARVLLTTDINIKY